MTKRNSETFAELCDILVNEPHYAAAARRLGINVKTILRWLYGSQLSPADYTFTWSDYEAPLHEHVKSAMRLSAHLLESKARHDAIHGTDEPVIYQGQVQYQVDPRLVGKDLDECELWHGHRDHFLRDAAGNCIPLTINRPPSDALRMKMLSAHFPTVYGDHSTVDVRHGGSVKVLSPYSRDAKPMKQIESKPVAPAEDRLAEIRARMKAEAEAHLARKDRVTMPRGIVKIIPAGDVEINDGKKRAREQRYQGIQPAGDGVERTGRGADPRSPDGKGRGFKQA